VQSGDEHSEGNPIARLQAKARRIGSVVDLMNSVPDSTRLLTDLWQSRKIWLATTAVCMLIAVGFYFVATPIYEADVLVAPSQTNVTPSMSGLSGRLGGLAGLIGLDLGALDEGRSQTALELLTSRSFLGEFFAHYHLAPGIWAAKSWNKRTQALQYDLGKYDPMRNMWTPDASRFSPLGPTPFELYDRFTKKNLFVVTEKAGGFVRIKVRHLSPVFAQSVANSLVVDLNEKMRSRAIDSASRNLKRLQDALPSVDEAEIRKSVSSLIEEESKTLTLAQVERDYAFTVLDPATVPDERYFPRLGYTIAAGVCIGLILGFTLSFAFPQFALGRTQNPRL
jgi:uncharacterized protein involved in exopolysaccharide biosynthesis